MASGRSIPRDMISDLPDNAMEAILMFLPTRDAIRTSILSRRWRYCWAKLPQLILDRPFWKKLKYPHKNTLSVILCQLLLLHEGPINKFTLSISGSEFCPEIDNLICFLSRNGIEDLNLEFITKYRLPSSFFACQQMRHLSLTSCFIDVTSDFKGFSRLVTLKLRNVAFKDDVLGRLISSSLLLELLELEISYFHDLEIDAPNLKTFSFKGLTNSIIFKKVPLLVSVSILPSKFANKRYLSQKGKCTFAEFFRSVPVLEKLHLGNPFVESFATDLYLDIRASKYSNTPDNSKDLVLTYLEDLKLFDLDLRSPREILFIIFCIRRSPKLKLIDIKLNSHVVEAPPMWLENSLSSLNFNSSTLKEVKLQNVIGTWYELQLIKILLGSLPRLEKMTIRLKDVTSSDEGYEILKELMKYQRASMQAEVIIIDK